MGILDTIRAVRAEIGPVFNEDGSEHLPYPTREQLGWMLNKIAWIHRADGWGLSVKTYGYNVPAPDGELIASDILHNRNTNIIYDVFISAGERTEPAFNEVGLQTNSSRPWKAPVKVDVPEVPNPGNPGNTENPPSQCKYNEASVEALMNSVLAMHEEFGHILRKLDEPQPIELSLPKWLGGTIRGWVGKK